MIHWYRAAAKVKKQITQVTKPTAPKGPKSIAPKKPKKVFTPKSPQAWKRKLYIPKRFIQAADGIPGVDMAELEKNLGLLQNITPDDQGQADDLDVDVEQGTTEPGDDLVVSRLQTIPNIKSIKWVSINSRKTCGWCRALGDGKHIWSSVSEFAAAKPRLIKPPVNNDKQKRYLAHPGCDCHLEVTTDTGVETVNSMGA